MKKQTNPNIKAHLIQSAFYLILLFAVCAIPFALAQSGTRAASHNLPADAETESMAPATLAPAVVAYIPNSGSNNVSVIDTSSNTVIDTVAVGNSPHSVALKADGTRAYVANESSNNVSVIDTSINSVIATVAVNESPSGVVLNPDGTRAYVANNVSNNVSVIDTSTNTVIATAAVGTTPSGSPKNLHRTRHNVAN